MAAIFEGVRIIDFSAHTSGPLAGALFADLGAEVIKVEPPVHGDDIRGLPPRIDGQNPNFMWNNRGKKSVTLDLKDPDGLEIAKKLIASADAVLENFRPGVMKRLHLSYEDVIQFKPDIVYCSLSAFGQFGPMATNPGFDIIIQARSGIMSMTGEPDGSPTKCGVVMADIVAAKDTFGAMCAALYHKLRTGEGQYIDMAMLQSLTGMNLYLDHIALGRDPQRRGKYHLSLSPYGIYEGKNGQAVVLAAYVDKHYYLLCDLMGHPELKTDPRTSTAAARVDNYLFVAKSINEWLSTFDNIDDAVELLSSKGIVCSKILSTKEAANDPQLLAHGGMVDIPAMPSMKHTKTWRGRGPWMRFSKTPVVMKRACELGENNYDILGELGISREEVDCLQNRWAEKYSKKGK